MFKLVYCDNQESSLDCNPTCRKLHKNEAEDKDYWIEKYLESQYAFFTWYYQQINKEIPENFRWNMCKIHKVNDKSHTWNLHKECKFAHYKEEAEYYKRVHFQ